MEAQLSVKDITILGSSAQQPTRDRNHGGYLVRWNEEGLLFDPGEGTQRQFIFANVAPPTVTRILISHFHGDHCLGLGSMIMRLNLDKVQHPIHCYYPAEGKENFDRLVYGCVYHKQIEVIEHPVSSGDVFEDETFRIEAKCLDHGIVNMGYRITEKPKRKFDENKLKKAKIRGLHVRMLIEKGSVTIDNKTYSLEDVSYMVDGDTFAYVMDTRPCDTAYELAQNAKVLLSESTFLEEHADLAKKYKHMTAKEAAQIAKDAKVELLLLSHFSARYRTTEEFERQAKEIFSETIAVEDLQKILFPR